MNVTIVRHPVAAHLLTSLRDSNTEPAQFRTLTHRLTVLLALEASRYLRTRPHPIQTPLEPFEGVVLDDPIVVVPVLRAGLGMLDPIVDLFPDISVGYIGLERDEQTAIASLYYAKLPPQMMGRTTFVLDPMLATGGSAEQAVSTVKAAGAGQVLMLSIIAAPPGVERLNAAYPDVPIIIAGLDRALDASSFIVPGLGDFGDRLYGTVPSMKDHEAA